MKSGHAVVIGGSMAGMLAARVLADHFNAVTILERDRLPALAAPRKGTPQARHLHVLLERGRQILEQFFPGLTDELTASGAMALDTAADFSILNPAGWSVQFPSGIRMLTCSRDLLDWQVRRRLAHHSVIRFDAGVDVTGLEVDACGSAISGVRIRRRGESEAGTAAELVRADLVVDASGRGSRLPRWLRAIGFDTPDETVVDTNLTYATRVYRRSGAMSAGRHGIFIQALPPGNSRSGVAVPIERDRWIVTVSGRGSHSPPSDEAGFLEFLRTLRSPAIHHLIQHAEPLTPIYSHCGLENRIRHIDRMDRWPERFIALGDAVCAFNPVYAQGITTAALGAVTLDQCLPRFLKSDGIRSGFAARFQARLAKSVKAPWLLATSEDRRYQKPGAEKLGLVSRLSHAYMDRVFELITRSSAVRRRSLEVFHLLRHPVLLFHPGNLVRVVALMAQETIGSHRRRALDAAAAWVRARMSRPQPNHTHAHADPHIGYRPV